MPTARHRTANPPRLDRPLIRRRRQADASLPQRVESDLSTYAPVGEAELDAIERLLGDDLAGYLAALH
jgi:hypothetical protein